MSFNSVYQILDGNQAVASEVRTPPDMKSWLTVGFSGWAKAQLLSLG
ncbi:MAG: hypothetical protein MUC60_02945 [Oscillatoria sp. Prado101]|nr:hypothetical protein [Oscillatoria sp. Prado101]